MPQSRRLAAIMFADIAGYTAMMQRNEKEGLKKVHRFSEVMEAQAATNHGEILEFRGDGCLAVFKSAVEAMHAAKSIQESLKEEPQVPLRIGIHIGDIVFTEGNIYGDGVNLASRVESMGVPGSILVTERVIHDVKSHPEFEMASLGKFQFKNVEKPIEVFALANEGFVVPKAEQMKGKGNAFDNPTDRISSSKTSMPILKSALGLLIGGLLIWGLGNFLTIENKNQGETKFNKDKSIAVLPFRNMSNDSTQEYFSEGISEDILTQLARIGDLMVIARTSSFSFKETDLTIPEIAKKLNVAHILEGSVRREKDKVRITTQLVHAESGALLWAGEFDNEVKDIFAVQREVSHNIVKKLSAKLSEDESVALNQNKEFDPEAYDLFLRVRQLYPASSKEQLEVVKQLLDRIIDIDSTYADAYAMLGGYYLSRALKNGDLPRDSANTLAQTSYKKALGLDPRNGLAYGNWGLTKLWLEWDMEGALDYLEKAKEYGEKQFPIITLYAYIGNLNMMDKEVEEKMSLNPQFKFNYIWKGCSLFLKGEYYQARDILSEINLSLPSNTDGYKFLAKTYFAQQKLEEAIQTLEQSLQFEFNQGPYILGDLAIYYFLAGREDEANEIIEGLKLNWQQNKRGSPAFFLGLIYANMGQIDTAFEWLEKSFEDHEVEMLWLKMDPLTKPLHADPRYQNLIDRVGFP